MAAIRTNDGRLVDPFNPQPADVRPRVFCHSLAQINRYTGQSDWPYSVGQHTLNLYRVVPTYLRKAALVHDCGETWFNDLASPVKKECPEYAQAEDYAKHFIAEQIGVGLIELVELDWYDKQIYINERNALFSVIAEQGMGDDRVGLEKCRPGMFAERNWRDVKLDLNRVFMTEFGPEIFNR